MQVSLSVGDAGALKFGKKYLSCAPLKVKKRKEALILYG
jgi:hypothetical protein